MDKTVQLIKRQRITIAVLLLGLIAISVYAGRQVRLRRLHANEVKVLLQELKWDTQFLQRVSDELDRRENVHKTDQKTIRDLEEQLRTYEARYGDISPVRKGEGVTVGHLGLRPQVDR